MIRYFYWEDELEEVVYTVCVLNHLVMSNYARLY